MAGDVVRRPNGRRQPKKQGGFWGYLIGSVLFAGVCFCGRIYLEAQATKMNSQRQQLQLTLEDEKELTANLSNQYSEMCMKEDITVRAREIGMIPPDGSNVRVSFFYIEQPTVANAK